MIAEYIHNNPRVFGSFLIGLALVSGAYVISNFGRPTVVPQSATVAIADGVPGRVFIPVVDADGNGIEDWREEFVLRESIILPTVLEDIVYEQPTTLTGQVSQQFFESILRNQMSSIGPTNSDVIKRTAETVARVATSDGLYDTYHINIIPTNNESVRRYANAMGSSITNNDIQNYENEVTIMERAIRNEDPDELTLLIAHTSMYKALRDEGLRTPVPDIFIKQHLDLINTYHALYKGLGDAQLIFDDPMLALMRIKRYQDDVTGLGFALRNMFTALVPYANLFSTEDPAVVFVAFSPDLQ
jgi:hypothetical protein